MIAPEQTSALFCELFAACWFFPRFHREPVSTLLENALDCTHRQRFGTQRFGKDRFGKIHGHGRQFAGCPSADVCRIRR